MSRATAVISLATVHRRFPESMARLAASLTRAGFTGEVLCWPPGDFPAGCPSHEDTPFAFKPFCFRAAAARGLELVLWLDAACVVVRDLAPLFAALRERGYLLFRNRHQRVGEWASDEALSAFAMEREEALRLPEIDAAALGLDLGHPLGRAFLDQWHAAARNGIAFRGTRRRLGTAAERSEVKWNRGGRISADPRVRGHRHDQTVAGILAHRLQLTPARSGLQKVSRRLRWIRWRTVVVVDRDAGHADLPLRSVESFRRDRYVGGLMQLLVLARGARSQGAR